MLTHFQKPLPRILAILALFAAMLATTVATSVVTATKAHADGWLHVEPHAHEGTSGEDVRQLQIRVAGYPAYGSHIAADGAFGPATKAAVQRFQSAYVWARTASPVPRPSARSTRCRTTTARRSTSRTPSSTTVVVVAVLTAGRSPKPRPRRTPADMWQLEAMRHALGDQPLTIPADSAATPATPPSAVRATASTCTGGRLTSSAHHRSARWPSRPATTVRASSAPATRPQ